MNSEDSPATNSQDAPSNTRDREHLDELVVQIRSAIDEDERIALASGRHSVAQTWRPGISKTCPTCGSLEPSTPRVRACVDGWHRSPESEEYAIVIDDAGFRMATTGSNPRAEHIARHDPAAVQRKVAGARKILELHRAGPCADGPEGIIVCATCGPHGDDGTAWMFEKDARSDRSFFYPCDTVKTLAEMFGVDEVTDGSA